MKIYISLPISGKDIEEVKLKARETAVLLEEDGHVPITPFEVSPNPNATYAEHMGKDIQALLECDAVMFLQGWHDSKGCLAEFEVAKIYGKKLIFE